MIINHVTLELDDVYNSSLCHKTGRELETFRS